MVADATNGDATNGDAANPMGTDGFEFVEYTAPEPEALGKLFAGMGFAAMSYWLSEPHDQVPLWIGLACGSVFAIVGLFGDLTVSLFKRGAGLKDSSTVLAGIGGVLDILDSPLMVAPVAYWMLTILPSI